MRNLQKKEDIPLETCRKAVRKSLFEQLPLCDLFFRDQINAKSN